MDWRMCKGYQSQVWVIKNCSVLPRGFIHYIAIVYGYIYIHINVCCFYWYGSDKHPFERKILEVMTSKEHTPDP